MRSALPLLPLALLAACSGHHDASTGNSTAPGDASTRNSATPAVLPAGQPMTLPTVRQQDSSDPIRFQPLASQAVQDAIHRALRTGQTQRWQDGALAGYAVPSQATNAQGCRAVRYTVDQRASATPTITACDAH